MPGEAALEVVDLVKDYGSVRAVDGVSFSVPRGHVFCLLGPNGAGKTTTLEIAQGLRRPTSGVVRLFGEDPRRASPALRRRVGSLPQSFSCYELLSPRENVEYWRDVYGVSADVPALLESLGLAEHADRPYRTLSGGTKRRVAIAAALVSSPDLVFLDEPTAGVDPASRRQLWEVVRSLRREGRSVVLTTHYMDEAERLADEVAIVRDGRIVARGSPEKVRLAHGGGVVVRVRGLDGPLPPSLALRPGARMEGDEAVIPLSGPGEGPAVLAELVKAGTRYRELSVHEPTLDDAFVRLVAREA